MSLMKYFKAFRPRTVEQALEEDLHESEMRYLEMCSYSEYYGAMEGMLEERIRRLKRNIENRGLGLLMGGFYGKKELENGED